MADKVRPVVKKSFKQSHADSLETVLDFLCGWI